MPENAADVDGAEAATTGARRPDLSSGTGLVDIIEKMVEEKRKQAETANGGDPAIQGDNKEGENEKNLRDRTFTKSELAKLEKKSWIEIKDLIFETEPQVLDYLSHHCRRYRDIQDNKLADIALAKNKAKLSGRRGGKTDQLNTMNSTVRSFSQTPNGNINLA